LRHLPANHILALRLSANCAELMTNIAPKIKKNQETRQGLKPLFNLLSTSMGLLKSLSKAQKPKSPKALASTSCFQQEALKTWENLHKEALRV